MPRRVAPAAAAESAPVDIVVTAPAEPTVISEKAAEQPQNAPQADAITVTPAVSPAIERVESPNRRVSFDEAKLPIVRKPSLVRKR